MLLNNYFVSFIISKQNSENDSAN